MKTVIECLRGATEQTIGGITYSFNRDEHGRFVNEVNSVLHRSIFLNVEHYREAPLDPPPLYDEIPAFLSGQSGAGEGGDDSAMDDDAGDEDGSNSGDETNALDGDEQTGGEQGTGEENASGPADASQRDGEADKQPELAPVAAPAKTATSKSK